MTGPESNAVNRRSFLQAGAVATASALAAPTIGRADEPKEAGKKELPRRPLGKTGVEVTALNLGTWRSTGLDRLLKFAYASGVRVFDAADCYGSEPGLGRWFQERPEVRDEIFLVTKSHPRQGPQQLIPQLDERLQALKTDRVDLLFIHGIGPGEYGRESLKWPKSKEFADVIEKIKKSGKAKFVGFSTHHATRAQIIEAAAEGGFVDAIMLQYTPFLAKDAPLNKALDAAWKKGIGLISMKQVAGNFVNNQAQGKVLDEVVRRVPMLKEKNLTPYQGLLHSIWTDERISSSCVSMRNTDQIRENTDAAQRFEPLKQAEIHQLRDACLAYGQTLCADCDGRCSRAAGTQAELGNLTRFLTYHEHHGLRSEARREYANLAQELRDWSGADLAAAREACPNRLDFAKLLPEVDRHLA